MHIYIDESGQFIGRGNGPPKAAVVGSLVVPSYQRIALHRAYKKLRKSLRGGSGEMKGSSLNESEAVEVIELCRAFDVLLPIVIIDLASISEADVQTYRDGAAEKLLENLTRDHQPGMVHDIWLLSEALRRLSPQLFLQAFASMQLVKEVLETATLYYVQRSPGELGSFDWVVDAKDRTPTLAERTWSTILLPLMQTSSREKPMIMLAGADYSVFDTFTAPILDDYGRPTGRDGTDLRKVIGEHLRFSPSNAHLGLQIADNLVALVGRALNGRIAESAVKDLGRLMPRWPGQAVKVLKPQVDPSEGDGHDITDPRWIRLITRWTHTAKGILKPEVARGA